MHYCKKTKVLTRIKNMDFLLVSSTPIGLQHRKKPVQKPQRVLSVLADFIHLTDRRRL